MEIEQETTKNLPKTDISENELKLNYLSQILGVKLNDSDLQLFQDISNLSDYVNNNIKFNDKKKNEIKDSLIENIKKSDNKKNIEDYIEDKNKQFTGNIKLNGKTIFYLTAEKDELSKTMHAFYFSDKSKQVFSDKQTAEYKAMHFDTGYEINLENTFKQHSKEEDNISSYSNLGNPNENNVTSNENKFSKKKRKSSTNFSSKSKSCKKRKLDKKNNNEEVTNINNKRENDNEEQDGEYCIISCKYSRKSKGLPMIQCDKCKKWYHTKCLSFTTEEFHKFQDKNKMWYCPICSKNEADDKKVNNGNNGNNAKN